MKSLSDLLAPLSDPTDRLRLEAFGQMYTTPGHLWLARCAAFPVALTTDLLYKIWLNFRQTDTGETIDIPINAVGDILLSPLCHEIGYDLYEMYPEARAVLWQSLSADAVASLAEFTLRYLDFCRDKVPSEAFAEAQRIWAESFQHPQKVAQLLRLLLSERKTNAGSKIMADYVLSWVKNRNQWANQKGAATTAQRDSLSDLAQVAEGIQQYEKGDITEAKATFSSISHLLQAPRAGGFNVPIAKEIWQNLPMNAPVEGPKGKIYAVLVGIDEYEMLPIVNFKHGFQDAIILKALLEERFNDSSKLSISLITNKQATKSKILQDLQTAFSMATENDTVLFFFSGHGDNQPNSNLLLLTNAQSYNDSRNIFEVDIKSILVQSNTNPYLVIVLDTHAGSANWIDINNEKHILFSATAIRERALEIDKRGLFSMTIQEVLNEFHQVTYHKFIRESFKRVKEKNPYQHPQLFGQPQSTNQVLQNDHANPKTVYINELINEYDFSNLEEIKNLKKQENLIAFLEKYALLKGAEKLKIVRISSEISLQQIPLFQKEYLKSLPYKVEIKDISLFYSISRAGLKDGLGPEEDNEDNLSALQDAHIIVFVLNHALINDFVRHSSIAPVVNHLKRFEYKVVCSILWEDCDRGDTALRDYPAFSLRQPLSQALFQKYNFGSEVEREIEEYYQDWQPVINKWITDLAALGFEKELKERIEKAKQTQELDLSGMGFEKLPEAVWELENLKIIDLYNNKLSELPESLTQFQSLEKLYASKNPITSLPLFLSDLPNLRVLKIDDAQITEFPNWLCKHPALEDISLENNQIEIIPSALKDLPKLRLFDFRGNMVINLPQSILKATKGKLTEYIPVLRTNPPVFSDYRNKTVLLFLGHGDENGELNLIQSFFATKMKGESLSGKPFDDIYSMDIYKISPKNYESIFHFTISKHKTLIIHFTQTDLSDDETKKISKLFLEYPTGTIFFLNFSQSKRLGELLYQQKHSPIIAFNGELDPETANEAAQYFYSRYQVSPNVEIAFEHMKELLLAVKEENDISHYIIYRY